MKRIKVSLVVLIFWLMTFAFSCAVVMVPYSPGRAVGWERKVFDRTLSLPSGGTVDISLEGVKADVEIAGREAEEVKVAVFQVYPFTRRVFFAAAQKASSLQVATDTSASLVSVRVRGRRKEIFLSRVKLEVPRPVELNLVGHEEGDIFIHDLFGSIGVNFLSGNLLIKNYSGSIEASVGEGNIEVEILDTREGDKISLTTDKGDITVFLETQAGARVQAQAPEGKIYSDFYFGESSDNYLAGILGEGKADFILKAIKGNIRLKKIE